jgi:hypothetical protein
MQFSANSVIKGFKRKGDGMSRYLMLLGVVIIVFSVAGGSIEISSSYNDYQSRLHVSGVPGSNPLTVLDEARWQFARLIGGAVIAGGLISGSMLMGLAWIGSTIEQVRDALSEDFGEAAPPAAASAQGD